jgi:hypothetical protein
MASRTLRTNNGDTDPEEPTLMEATSDDDITEAAGSNRGKNDAVEVEKNVKWQMPGNHDAVSMKRQLQHLLANLLIYNPGDATLIDNKQREWSFLETQDEEKFMAECEQMSVQVHPIKNKQNSIIRWVAITRIQSISTIQDWKFNDHFYSVVNEAETYIFPHPFAYDQWDTRILPRLVLSRTFTRFIIPKNYYKTKLSPCFNNRTKTHQYSTSFLNVFQRKIRKPVPKLLLFIA